MPLPLPLLEVAGGDEAAEDPPPPLDEPHAAARRATASGAMLMRLRDEGRRLGIVTSKLRTTVDIVLDQISYGPAFEVIVTAEDTARHKPDPDPILLALERMKVGPDAAIYVGDSPYDILAGRAAGVATGAATWGIHPRDDLLELWPDHVFDSPLQVVAA